ncbi:AI-2E family transporter [Terriglobus sp.]|uniref:AI-2E family transporter n=1 Tax=Terriglobus sp. TaxID=1889013 RepID=UPI003B00DED5
MHVDAALLPERRRVRGYILFTFVLAGALALAWKLHHVLLILYVSGLFAVVLTPIVKRLEKIRFRNRHAGKGTATILLFAGIFLALTLFFWIGFPPVIRDFASFVSDLPHRIPQALAKVQRLPLASKVDMSKVAAEAQNVVGAFAAYVFDALPRWATHLFDVLTGVILCVYFILEGEEVYQYFLSLWPIDKRTRLANTLLTSEERVSKWLFGQLTLMAAVAIYMLIVFGALHVRYFVLLGILMGITNLIPVAGNLITITIAIMVAASDSWTKALGVVIAYVIYVQIENAILTPRIMKTSVDLMGITVLVALLCGTEIAGIVGALVAVPTAAMVVVFANEYLVQHDDAPGRVT